MKKYLSLSYSAIIYILVGAIPCSAELAPAKAPPATAQKIIFFTFQVEATANKNGAYILKKNLLDKGYPAYVEEVSENTGKTTYRVRVGKYQTREDAENAARVFYGKEKKSYWITATQSAPAELAAAASTAPTAKRRAEPSEKEVSSAPGERKEPEKPAAVEKTSEQQKSLHLKSPPQPTGAQNNIFFTFQVETIENKNQAYGLEENLMDKGYPAYVEEVSYNTGKITYQVRVGKYQTREDAEKAAHTFYEKEKKPYLITATQSDPVESSAAASTAPTGERSAEPSLKELSSARSEKKEPGATATAEKTSEQEKSPQLKSPPLAAAAEQKAWAAAVTTPAAAQPEIGWPPVVTRIYTYYDPQGYLRITNSAEKIPGELQNNIESVSIFPVKYLSFNQKKKVLALDIAGKQEELQLSGVDLDASAAVKNAAAYFEKTLKDVPLRLKYAPAYDGDAKKKSIWGSIFFKQGASLNIELVRQGIAPCDADSAPSSQKQAYREAEAVARRARVGIWAEHAGAQ
jgi:cell division septation protein DedD